MDLSKERAYLDETEALLKIAAEQTETLRRETATEMEKSRADMWDDLPHFVRDASDAALLWQQDMTMRQTNDVYIRARENRMRLRALQYSPYFARIDFCEEGEEENEKFYIGRFSFRDPISREYRIIDWRTPIASLFYDSDPGLTAYETPAGKIGGELTLKRQFRIREGKLEYAFDTDVTIQDRMLERVLGESTDGQLKVIVSSIQREQNSVIRYRGNGDLIILGAAGSGKTSVGMHRLAWMLYHRRDLLAKQVLVVSANRIFNSYIASILPELGEAQVRCTAYDDLFLSYLPEGKKLVSWYKRQETSDSNPDDHSLAEKTCTHFTRDLEMYVCTKRIFLPDVIAERETILTEGVLSKLCGIEDISVSPAVRLERAKYYVREGVAEYYRIHADEVRKAIEREADGAIFKAELESLIRHRRQQAVRLWENTLIEANGLTPERIYRAFLNEKGIPYIENDTLLYEDYIGILLVGILIGTVRKEQDIRVLLLDEAQDYSPLQHRLLELVFPRAERILLADPGQAISGAALRNESDLKELYPKALVMKLERSYRCSGPIMALAEAVTSHNDMYFNRAGESPCWIRCTDVRSAACYSMSEPLIGKTGILTRTAAQAIKLAEGFRHPVQAVTEPDAVMRGPVMVMPVRLAKGLEFDRVILIADTEMLADRNMLYLACTRALHRLYIVSGTEMPDNWRPYCAEICI